MFHFSTLSQTLMFCHPLDPFCPWGFPQSFWLTEFLICSISGSFIFTISTVVLNVTFRSVSASLFSSVAHAALSEFIGSLSVSSLICLSRLAHTLLHSLFGIWFHLLHFYWRQVAWIRNFERIGLPCFLKIPVFFCWGLCQVLPFS